MEISVDRKVAFAWKHPKGNSHLMLLEGCPKTVAYFKVIYVKNEWEFNFIST